MPTFLPLINHVAMWGYGITIGFVVLVLAVMILLIRLLHQDPDNQGELKQFVDAMFHSPSFSTPNAEAIPNGEPSAERQVAAASAREPFEDRCPGCGTTVTHEHAECPSCGLRLLG